MRFGYGDLMRQDLTTGFSEMKSMDIARTAAHDAFLAVGGLRNAVCHPGQNLGPQQTKAIHKLLVLGHALTVNLHMCGLSEKFCALRAGLRERGSESFGEMALKFQKQTP